MKRLFLSIVLTCFAFSFFSTTAQGEIIYAENIKPLDCTVSSGSGSGLSASGSTCENAMEMLSLMEEVYWE